jgi:hypothetical protein
MCHFMHRNFAYLLGTIREHQILPELTEVAPLKQSGGIVAGVDNLSSVYLSRHFILDVQLHRKLQSVHIRTVSCCVRVF